MDACTVADGAPRTSHCDSWGQRVGAFARLPELVAGFDADFAAVLGRAGLAPDAIAQAELRIPFQSLPVLLQEAARQTGCEHIGLLLGSLWRLGDLGLLGEATRQSPSVGVALRTLVAHQYLDSDGGLAFLIHRGAWVDFGYAIYHPSVVQADELYDALLAGALNFMRELCGPHWWPTDVFFPYARPEDTSHHRRCMKVTPQFGAEFCALRFPAEQLRLPVVSATPGRWSETMSRLGLRNDAALLQRVYRTVRRQMLEDLHGGDEVAEALTMHRRTLNRHLQALGITFQQVLDDVRFQVARELLAAGIAPDDIAATLGYSGLTPFMRAFRRWSGTTPGQWRCSVARRPVERNLRLVEPVSRPELQAESTSG